MNKGIGERQKKKKIASEILWHRHTKNALPFDNAFLKTERVCLLHPPQTYYKQMEMKNNETNSYISFVHLAPSLFAHKASN
jgi:hypothetical protein